MFGAIDFRLKCWYKDYCNMASNDCQRTCHRYLEMNCLINNSGMKKVEKYLKQIVAPEEDLDAYMELASIKNSMDTFVEEGRNLFITSSNFQNGKTTWALKLMYKYFDLIWNGNGFVPRGYFLYVPDFLDSMRSFEFKNTPEYAEINRMLNNASLVVWDDISTNNLSQQDQNTLNRYIDKRLQRDLSNVFTGLDFTKHPIELGSKLKNRLENSKVIRLNGEPVSH